MPPEKKVRKNTFQAFTGKLDKPIESKFKTGDVSLEGRTVLTSLNHEQNARCGSAINPQIINGREGPGAPSDFSEKNRLLLKERQKYFMIGMCLCSNGPVYFCVFLHKNTNTSIMFIFALFCHCSFSH